MTPTPETADIAGLVERALAVDQYDDHDTYKNAPLFIELATALQSLSAELVEARRALEIAERDAVKFQAIAEDKLADTRLVNAGGRAEGGFGFGFTGGPIPYITEYLFQFIGARDEKGPSNYAEIEVSHHEFGAMTLTLQRRTGKTPHQLRAEFEARATTAEADARAMREALEPFALAAADIYDDVLDSSEMWEHPASMSVTAGDFRRAALAREGK